MIYIREFKGVITLAIAADLEEWAYDEFKNTGNRSKASKILKLSGKYEIIYYSKLK